MKLIENEIYIQRTAICTIDLQVVVKARGICISRARILPGFVDILVSCK